MREVAEGLPEMERTVAMTGPFGLEFGTRNAGTEKGADAGTRKGRDTEIRNSRMPKAYRIHGAVQCGVVGSRAEIGRHGGGSTAPVAAEAAWQPGRGRPVRGRDNRRSWRRARGRHGVAA
ncbi:hypothetical protein GCM10009646_24970 [Streptomyces aureus]